MIVVVGGSSRKVGQDDRYVRDHRRDSRSAWTAFKISPHEHEPGMTGDTEALSRGWRH